MSELKTLSCEACRADAPRLNEDEIEKLLPELPGWQLTVIDGVKQLSRTFTFKNFVESLEFTNKIGQLAEENGHHPAILTEWGKVTVSWWTHKIKGLHKNDFIMAAKTGELSF